MSNLNSLVVFDGLVQSPSHGIAFKPEIFSVEMVKKGKHDLNERLDKNDFAGATDDYLSLLQIAKEIGSENLDESEKNNLEISKNDLKKIVLTLKNELVAIGYSKLSSEFIKEKSTSVAVEITKTFMETERYPHYTKQPPSLQPL